MKFVSVRALSILLSLTLVVVTAAICLSISVTTAEDALSKTQKAGNNGIDGAFDTASVNVKNLADSLMAQILSTSVLFVNDFLDAQLRIITANAEYFRILANTPTLIGGQPTIEFFDYNKLVAFSRPFYGQIISNPTSGIWVTNALGMHVLAMESTDTVGTTGPKEYRVLFNNGTDRTAKLKNTIFGAMDYRMQFLNKNNTCTGGLNCPYMDSDDNLYGACPGSPLGTCPVMSRPFYDPLGMGYVPLAFGVAPEGSSWWTNVISIPPYVGTGLVAPVSSQYVPKNNVTKQKVGLVGLGVDLRFITKFLQTLTLPTGSRIFVVDAMNNPLIPTPTMGTLAGAATGRSFTEYLDVTINGTVRLPINCTMSDDNVTRDACLWVFNSGRPNPFMTMNPNMTYEAELAGAPHFVKSRLVKSGNGLIWSLILVTPRRTIMGAIDDAVEQTHRTIDDELKKTREEKERGYMIMYIILGVSAATLIIASIMFTLAITAPMIVLQDEMACVAMMKLEYVDLQRPKSSLEEVGSMQTSFLQMVSNLVEYRNYMPASILANDDDEEEDTTMAASGVGKTIDGGEASFLDQSVNKQDKLESSFKPRQSVHSDSQKSEMASRAVAKKAQVSSMEVKNKRVTIMVMNLKRWQKTQQAMGPSESAALHSQYVKLVMDTVTAQKGTPDVFMGDRFFASWNAIKQIGTHRTLACTTVVQVTTGLKSITETELNITAGLATSEVRCGNMGCDGMKKYTFIGGCASLAPILERLNRRYKTNVLMDGGVEEEAKNNFLLRKIDHISVLRIQEKTIKVFELLGAKKVSEDEWMYQLEEGDAANPYTAYSTAVDLYWKGSYAEAKGLLEKCSVKDDALAVLTERVESAIQSNLTGSPKVVDETIV